jgi:hypothetical protein
MEMHRKKIMAVQDGDTIALEQDHGNYKIVTMDNYKMMAMHKNKVMPVHKSKIKPMHKYRIMQFQNWAMLKYNNNRSRTVSAFPNLASAQITHADICNAQTGQCQF